MARSTGYNLLVVGYRNDLARERVIDFARKHPRLCSTAPPLARDTKLPCTLFTGLDQAAGLRLSASLRDLGAYVRLVSDAPAEAPAAPLAAAAPAARRRPYVAVLALACAGALLLRFGGPDAMRSSAAPPRASAPSTAPELRALNDRAVELNARGEYEKAADELRRAVEMDPEQPVVRQNLKTVLNNLAVAQLNAERREEAIAIAEEALALGDEDAGPSLSVIGIAHARNGEWDRARDALERAVEFGQDDANTLIALGNVYRQQGNREGAVEMFQRARENGAGEGSFVRTLQKLERELDTEWDFSELNSSHFKVSFAEGENHQAAQIILSGLENVYYSVGSKLGHYPDEPTAVVLYDRDEFHDITQTPSWAGGAYDGRIKLPVHGLRRDDPALDRTLRHEYAHVVIGHLTKGRCPVWLNEGVAIWAEEHFPGERLGWARQQVQGKRLFRFAELRRPFTQLPANRVPVAYAQSYLAVHAIAVRYGEHRIRELLAGVGSATSLESAFLAIFAEEFAAFEDELVAELTG